MDAIAIQIQSVGDDFHEDILRMILKKSTENKVSLLPVLHAFVDSSTTRTALQGIKCLLSNIFLYDFNI